MSWSRLYRLVALLDEWFYVVGIMRKGPLYFVSSLFLILGGGGIIFGFACGLWTHDLQSILLKCDSKKITECHVWDLSGISKYECKSSAFEAVFREMDASTRKINSFRVGWYGEH